MNMRLEFVKTLLLLNAALFWTPCALLAVPGDSRLGLGVNYIGGLARYHLNSGWAGELRYLAGSENAAGGGVASRVLGLRGYRFFREDSRRRLFLGAEAALVHSGQENTRYGVSGRALGGFAGLERRFGRRFFLGFDIGPYFLSLKEKATGVSDASLEFVIDTWIIFYLF